MPALCVATTVEELYNSVMVETPLGRLPIYFGTHTGLDMAKSADNSTAPYFRDCLSAHDLDELNIEIIRNTLYRAYLEDFHRFCGTLGDPTSAVMDAILGFEADRRTINITINSFGTNLSKEQRFRLFPRLGKLYPEGNFMLARADEVEAVKAVTDNVPEYRGFFEPGSGGGGARGAEDVVQYLEDHFFQQEVHLNKLAFLQQFQYGVFYAFFKVSLLFPLLSFWNEFGTDAWAEI